MTAATELRGQVEGRQWYHTLELAPGVTTAGWFDTRAIAGKLPFPDLTGKMVRDVKEESDLITIVLGDRSIFGDSTITMMFDPKTYDLRQWTITDAQKKDTSVMIFNVKTGMALDDKVFQIPYDEVRNKRGG